MSTPKGSRRAVYRGKRVDDKNDNDASYDEDERDKSYSSNKGTESDVSDSSNLGEDNTSRLSNRLRSKDSSRSSPSTPGSFSSSPPSNSPVVKKIYPDISDLLEPQPSHLDRVDHHNTSTPKSRPLDLNNSSTSTKLKVKKSESPSTKESSCNLVILVLIGALVAFVWYLVKSDPPESPPTLVPFNKYVIDIDNLSQQLPNQQKRLWTTIKASARHILNETQSDYPSVILMASDIHAGDTALCLARLIASRFESASRTSPYSSIADIAELKHLPHVEQKKALDENLRKLLRGHKSVIVNNLQLLSPEAALLLHAYCDNDNAPYKDVMIVLLFYTDGNIQLDPNRPNSFEAYLEEHWSKELHIDKVSAIMSRVANNIVVVTKESKAAIESACSNV